MVLNTHCKTCHKQGNNDYYANLEYRRSQIRNRNASHTGALQAAIWDYLVEHSCVDCGESDPVVLEFDHVRGEKVEAVAELVRRRCSLERMRAEIAKYG